MAKALTLAVFINMWNFIRNFLKFWTHCVQSLGVLCHGRIIEFCFRKHHQRHEHGMQKRHRSKLGQFGLYRKWIGAENYHAYSKISYGAGKRVCVCSKTTAYSNWKRRLLHWSCFLQLHFEVLCIDWFKNVKNYTSGCGADGYVYLHLNIKPAFHQKNSFGKRLKFRRDFIIYRKKKTKKIKIFKIWVEKGVSHKNMACVFSCLERKWYRMAQISQYELVLHKDDNWKIVG